MHLMDVMTLRSAYTSPDAKLADASALLADHDCGVLPVVDRDELRVVGMVTDRDICLVLGKQSKKSASEVPVRDAMTEAVFACRPEEKPREALETMRKHAVRRLPVIDHDGRLKGMVSINDFLNLVEKSDEYRDIGFTPQDVMDTLQEISRESSEPMVRA